MGLVWLRLASDQSRMYHDTVPPLIFLPSQIRQWITFARPQRLPVPLFGTVAFGRDGVRASGVVTAGDPRFDAHLDRSRGRRWRIGWS